MKCNNVNGGTTGAVAVTIPATDTKSVRERLKDFLGIDIVAKSRRETEEYSQKLCCTDKMDLMKYIILEKCADIKGVYASEDNCIHLKGRHSMHDVVISTNGASIISERDDRRTMMEAKSIMKFLSAYQGC